MLILQSVLHKHSRAKTFTIITVPPAESWKRKQRISSQTEVSFFPLNSSKLQKNNTEFVYHLLKLKKNRLGRKKLGFTFNVTELPDFTLICKIFTD